MIPKILSALDDDISLDLFLNGVQRNRLSRKQFYHRLRQLKDAGLVYKKHSHYELTARGIIVKRALSLISDAIRLRYKLEMYDECVAQYKQMPADHWAEKLFDTQEDSQILDLLLGGKAAAVVGMSEPYCDD